MATPEHPERRGIGCLLLLMGLLAIIGVFGVSLTGLTGGGTDGVEEIVEEARPGARKLVIIDIRGPLMRGSGLAGGVTGDALRMLDRAIEDDAVAGVLLRVDTPGGSVTDADLLHHRIGALKAKGRKVLVHMGDLCASGGYYLAVAAHEVWALPTTVTGSIGVIISNLELGGLLERFGVRDDSIASGRNKQLLSPFHPLTPEQRGLLQGIVDAMYQRFLEVVAEGRGLEIDAFRPLADGRVITAQTALDAKLVDRIGYPDEALDRLRAMAGEDAYGVVRYRIAPGLGALLGVRAEAPRSMVGELLVAPRPMYLYAPGALVEALP